MEKQYLISLEERQYNHLKGVLLSAREAETNPVACDILDDIIIAHGEPDIDESNAFYYAALDTGARKDYPLVGAYDFLMSRFQGAFSELLYLETPNRRRSFERLKSLLGALAALLWIDGKALREELLRRNTDEQRDAIRIYEAENARREPTIRHRAYYDSGGW